MSVSARTNVAIRDLGARRGRPHADLLDVRDPSETGTGRPVNTPRNCLSGPPTDAPRSVIENVCSSVECAMRAGLQNGNGPFEMALDFEIPQENHVVRDGRDAMAGQLAAPEDFRDLHRHHERDAKLSEMTAQRVHELFESSLGRDAE